MNPNLASSDTGQSHGYYSLIVLIFLNKQNHIKVNMTKYVKWLLSCAHYSLKDTMSCMQTFSSL